MSEPKIKRSLPLLDAAGRRLAIGGSFHEIPLYEDWAGYDEATARRAAMERKAHEARIMRVVQLRLFEEAA